MIAERWKALGYTDVLLNEIMEAYSAPARYYHNLLHIEALLALSEQYAEKLVNRTVVDLSIFYHDIIYKVPGGDNERQSAILATARLKELGLEAATIDEVAKFIEATKTHDLADVQHRSDLAYFLGFDMAILGAEWDEYLAYIKNIRREYAVFPDALYYPGRESFLRSTLDKPRIFLTDDLSTRFELQARENMRRELAALPIS
ncbi:MAG TPA: hypothetical protein VD996_01820 [Chitinophagaceae bacterium]|nr:hypothetical protein [Chitinophagaceae bacterium]